MKPNHTDSQLNHPSFLALDRAHLGTPASDVAAHLKGCEACRLYLGALAGPDFLPNIAEIHRAIERPRQSFQWNWLLAPASLMAAAFCVFLFVAHRDRNAARAE